MAPKCKSSDAGDSDIFLLCLIYKLSHKDVCIGKNIAHIGFGTIHDFRYPLEGGVVLDKGRLLYFIKSTFPARH